MNINDIFNYFNSKNITIPNEFVTKHFIKPIKSGDIVPKWIYDFIGLVNERLIGKLDQNQLIGFYNYNNLVSYVNKISDKPGEIHGHLIKFLFQQGFFENRKEIRTLFINKYPEYNFGNIQPISNSVPPSVSVEKSDNKGKGKENKKVEKPPEQLPMSDTIKILGRLKEGAIDTREFNTYLRRISVTLIPDNTPGLEEGFLALLSSAKKSTDLNKIKQFYGDALRLSRVIVPTDGNVPKWAAVRRLINTASIREKMSIPEGMQTIDDFMAMVKRDVDKESLNNYQYK